MVLSNWVWNDPEGSYVLWAVKKRQHPTVRLPIIPEPQISSVGVERLAWWWWFSKRSLFSFVKKWNRLRLMSVTAINKIWLTHSDLEQEDLPIFCRKIRILLPFTIFLTQADKFKTKLPMHWDPQGKYFLSDLAVLGATLTAARQREWWITCH